MCSSFMYYAQFKACVYETKQNIYLNSPIIVQMTVNISVPYF